MTKSIMGVIKEFKEEKQPKNVQQPYALTRQLLKFKYTIHEWRVLLRILQLLKHQQTLDHAVQIEVDNTIRFTFPVKSFMVIGHKNHGEVKKALLSLREKSVETLSHIEVNTGKGREFLEATEFSGIIERPKWSHNNSMVEFSLNENWYRFLVDLSKGYTQYLAEVAFLCSSPESVKFYQYINHWWDKKGLTLKISTFKKEFDISDSYRTQHIVDRFLDPIKEELDRISDRSFNYSLIYADGTERTGKGIRGKSVSKITLKFYSTSKAEKLNADFSHERTEAFINEINRRYTLDKDSRGILYTLIKTYSVNHFRAAERDNRVVLKGLKNKDFISKLTEYVRKI